MEERPLESPSKIVTVVETKEEYPKVTKIYTTMIKPKEEEISKNHYTYLFVSDQVDFSKPVYSLAVISQYLNNQNELHSFPVYLSNSEVFVQYLSKIGTKILEVREEFLNSSHSMREEFFLEKYNDVFGFVEKEFVKLLQGGDLTLMVDSLETYLLEFINSRGDKLHFRSCECVQFPIFNES